MPTALPPGMTWYPLYRRLDSCQGQSGWVWRISPTLGFEPWTIQPIAECNIIQTRNMSRYVCQKLLNSRCTAYKLSVETKYSRVEEVSYGVVFHCGLNTFMSWFQIVVLKGRAVFNLVPLYYIFFL